jgi:hypothetical protein
VKRQNQRNRGIIQDGFALYSINGLGNLHHSGHKDKDRSLVAGLCNLFQELSQKLVVDNRFVNDRQRLNYLRIVLSRIQFSELGLGETISERPTSFHGVVGSLPNFVPRELQDILQPKLLNRMRSTGDVDDGASRKEVRESIRIQGSRHKYELQRFPSCQQIFENDE